jgi:mono/diheme cytochrome c family protein
MHSALAPGEPPPRASFDAGVIAKGAQLAAIGNCNVCHTAPGGKTYAGGRPLHTPFGTMYGTNITPDPDTGIGRWSYAAFARAMREGVDREGRHLYPAFPYEYFTRLTDDDVRAIYAFVMTREPVRAESRPHELPFPFNLRSLIGTWKFLFFERGPFRPDASRNTEWNRGAYLVEGLAHCSACHTPRNFLGAEKKRLLFSGGEAEGWHGPALNAANPAPVPWTAEQLYTYLRTGLDELHAIAAGPMEPVVRNLAEVSEQDVRAIAAYLVALSGEAAPGRQKKAEEALSQAKRDRAARPEGATLYASACGVCHDQGRQTSSGSGLHLALATAVTVPTSKNLIRITLEGIAPRDGAPGRSMPGFAEALTDEQVKDLMVYIRAYYGQLPPWTDIDQELKKFREGRK